MVVQDIATVRVGVEGQSRGCLGVLVRIGKRVGVGKGDCCMVWQGRGCGMKGNGDAASVQRGWLAVAREAEIGEKGWRGREGIIFLLIKFFKIQYISFFIRNMLKKKLKKSLSITIRHVFSISYETGYQSFILFLEGQLVFPHNTFPSLKIGFWWEKPTLFFYVVVK